MSQERMELWSNDILTEFTIKLNSVTVVTTSNNPDTMTRSMNVLIDLAMNSIGTIRFLSGLFTIWQTNLLFYWTLQTFPQKEFNIRDDEDSEVDVSLYPPVNHANKVKNKRPPKPGLKCHFCNLKYCLEEERKQHEEFWHGNKLLKI